MRNELGGEFLCSVLKLWPKDKRSFHYFFHASPLIVSQEYVMTVCLKINETELNLHQTLILFFIPFIQ